MRSPKALFLRLVILSPLLTMTSPDQSAFSTDTTAIEILERTDDEPIDLVDRDDRIIGWCWRSELPDTHPQHCRTVNAFLINDLGQIWTPRRTASKTRFPLALDMSCGGYVTRGESYELAMRRELQEETGLDFDQLDGREVARLSPYDRPVSSFMAVYEFRTNQTPPWNREDFCEAYWLNPQDLIDRIQAGDRAKGDLIELITWLYGDRETSPNLHP
jgi:isopentenyldiphosphate isomerase